MRSWVLLPLLVLLTSSALAQNCSLPTVLPPGCLVACAPPGSAGLSADVSTPFATFDCSLFLTRLAAEMGLTFAALSLQTVVSSSSGGVTAFAAVAAPAVAPPTARDSVLAWLNLVRRGRSRIPGLTRATDLSTGAVVGVPTFPDTLDIIIFVLFGIAFTAFVVLLVIRCARKRSAPSSLDNRTDVPLMSARADDSNHDFAPAADHLRCLVVADVSSNLTQESGTTVLAVREGDTVYVAPADWRQVDSPWVWAQCGGKSGYVPRSSLENVDTATM